MSRVILAMSGGVDSSVAAWLLRQQGHEVIGVFMRHGQDQPPSTPAPWDAAASAATAGRTTSPQTSCTKQGCCTAADAADARRVADMLGIPFYAVNFQSEFDRIVDYFVAEYAAGRTPNPCIVCNTWLKFGRLFDYADQLGADYVATGHYARVLPVGGDSCRQSSDSEPTRQQESPPTSRACDVALLRGVDPSKDQSYVLFGIQRSLLPRLMFPVGEHRKEEIRQIAERLGLRVAAKRDSQEICFVPDQDHARFVRQRNRNIDTSGEIVTTEGTVVGHHSGFEQFTIGQRKGLRLAFGEPRYVVRIEPETKRVVIGARDELAQTELTASGANWLTEQGLDTSLFPLPSLRCSVKIRYRSPAVDATVEPLPDNRFRVRFDQPCHGVAPGQAAVCYQGDRVIGGGWIEGPT